VISDTICEDRELLGELHNMAMAKPPIPVHVLDDTRVHLAPPYHGRLRQGRLKTLCGKLAVSELPLFVMAETKGRCPKCFATLDEAATSASSAGSKELRRQARAEGRKGGKVQNAGR
jgi:hypothetical protein